jgi:hypothetical protein
MLREYEGTDGKDIKTSLEALFESHKGQFPDDFTLLDFVNNIFNFPLQTLENCDNEEELKAYITASLRFWIQEENFSILVNKKEVVK